MASPRPEPPQSPKKAALAAGHRADRAPSVALAWRSRQPRVRSFTPLAAHGRRGRRTEQGHESERAVRDMTPAAKKKGKYDAKFKLQVIHFAERFSNRAAGSKFGLNESTIRGWRKVKRGPSAALVVPAASCCALPAPAAPAPAVAPRRTPELANALPHEPARADAIPAPADGPLLYRKCEQPREPVAAAAEPASPPTLPPARTFLPTVRPSGPRRVLVRRSQLMTDGGFPELTVPFTVIAEKALRALYQQKHRQQHHVVAQHESSYQAPHMGGGCVTTNRELFASFLGLTPNRLVDNVT